jgi:diguanylate cyclase (GGDEF)-like protein/PAS domain S-box-containing protein
VSSAQNHETGSPYPQANRLRHPKSVVFFRCQGQGDYRLISISTNVESQWGYTTQECLDNKTLWLEQIHPEDLSLFRQQLCNLKPEQPQTCDYRLRHSDGSDRWLQTHLVLTSETEGSPLDIRGCSQDITTQRQLEAEKQLLHGVVESSFHVLAQTHYRTGMTKALAVIGAAMGVDRVYICECHSAPDADQEAVTMSFAWSREGWSISLEQMPWRHQSTEALQELSGYQDLVTRGYFAGMTRSLPHGEQPFFLRANICSTLWLPIELDHHFWGFIGLDNCQAERQWASESIDLLRTWAAIIGGALRHHQSEEQLVHDVFHDSLTGLPNRALFLNRLEQSLRRSHRHPPSMFAVLFLDLDGFKAINDTLGHQVGDQLLVALSKRLASCLRPGDTVSRLGGDEFVVLLNDLQGMGDATITAQRLRHQVSRAFQLGEYEVFTDVSVGIALSSYGYTTAEEILEDADRAMYEAKTAGKGRYRLFRQES